VGGGTADETQCLKIEKSGSRFEIDPGMLVASECWRISSDRFKLLRLDRGWQQVPLSHDFGFAGGHCPRRCHPVARRSAEEWTSRQQCLYIRALLNLPRLCIVPVLPKTLPGDTASGAGKRGPSRECSAF
jgi:hypothetical protein